MVFSLCFDQRLNYGNLDKALRNYKSWDVVNSSYSFENHPGLGYHGGIELTIDVTRQWGISIETNYLMGQSKIPMTGTYSGGSIEEQFQTVAEDFKDAKVDLRVWSFLLG